MSGFVILLITLSTLTVVGFVGLLVYFIWEDHQKRKAVVAAIKARGPIGTIHFHEDEKVSYEPTAIK